MPVVVVPSVINDSSVRDESVRRIHDDGRRGRGNRDFAHVFHFETPSAVFYATAIDAVASKVDNSIILAFAATIVKCGICR